ncbi:hypothetical protein G3I56_15795 [Streptomyces sp. SID12488]|nr:hypothetical protein [Streptomyces sp. SID12488]
MIEKSIAVDVDGDTARLVGRIVTETTVYGTQADWPLQSRPSRPTIDMNPNFVATTTWSQRPLTARPTRSSSVWGP